MSAALYLRGPNKKIGGIEIAGGIKITGGIKIIDEARTAEKTKKIIINFLVFG